MNSRQPKCFIETWRTPLVCLLLSLSTLIVYWRVHGFAFINFDDPPIIYQNPMVTNGLTLGGVRWGLSTSYYEYWHPVTWWSHMLDCQLFGLNAGAHHLVSLGFHIVNTLLLFGVLRLMTGMLLRSAIVAALFALHPMHVESVVWVAERKDLLSGMFWLLSIWAYVRYVQLLPKSRERSEDIYRISAVCFLCGLMCKPIVVTLPFVLLLLDYWPLNRYQQALPTVGSEKTMGRSNNVTKTLIELAREKLRFFCLAMVSCVITYSNVHAGGHVYSAELMPWSLRLSNVPVAYGRYLGKLIYPIHLAALYPMPDHWNWWVVGISSAVVLMITTFVLNYSRPAPYLFFGWFMFLGTLVPTLSLVAVGPQALADRYSYLAYIGLFVGAVWGIAELSAGWRFRLPVMTMIVTVALLGCILVTWSQVAYWRNNFTLWPHVLAVTSDNYPAQNNLGCALQEAGKTAEALPHYLEGVRLRPDFFDVNYNLGRGCLIVGEFKNATNYLAKAISIKSDYAEAHEGLGEALYQLNDYSGAEKECAEAVRLKPHDFNSLFYLARTVGRENKFDDAVHYFFEALRIYPASAEAHFYLGSEYLKHGLVDEAIATLDEALRLNPAYAEAQVELNLALSKRSLPKPPAAP